MDQHRQRMERAEREAKRALLIVLAGAALIVGLILYQAVEAFAEEELGPPGKPILIPNQEPPADGYRIWTREDAGQFQHAQEIRFPLRRPLDDSDPEMRAIVEAYLEQPPCHRQPGERCPRWREMQRPLKQGGDRLAEYLKRQYEASLEEGYMDTQTLLSMIARTHSGTGDAYIGQLVEEPRDRKELRFSLSALKECGSNRAVDRALDVLSRTPESDPMTRALAIRAVHWNLEAEKLDRPDALRELRSIAARGNASAAERGAATRALRALGE